MSFSFTCPKHLRALIFLCRSTAGDRPLGLPGLGDLGGVFFMHTS